MNKKDAERVLEIMTTADGGCSFCARALMDRFVKEFGFGKEATAIYDKAFEESDWKLLELSRPTAVHH